MCFTIFQNEKTPFQAIKTRSSKSGKIAIFPKGLVHGFGQKVTIFPSLFFFWQYRRGKCVFRRSKTRKRVSQQLNKKFKKWKNCHFSKGVSPLFWSKIGHFSIFIFKVIQAGKMCFTIFQNEKILFQAIKQEVQKVEKLPFLQRGYSLVLVKNWPFFHLFFFGQHRPGKCVLRYSTAKKRVSEL